MSSTTAPELEQDVVIRPAAPAERSALLEMYRQFVPKPASLGLPPRLGIEEWIEDIAGFPSFIALAGDKLVGHAVLCTEGDTGEVAVFVHQGYRNRGIGRQLLAMLVDQARKSRLRAVWGMTEPDNLPMWRIADCLGFARDWVKDPYLFTLNLMETGEE